MDLTGVRDMILVERQSEEDRNGDVACGSICVFGFDLWWSYKYPFAFGLQCTSLFTKFYLELSVMGEAVEMRLRINNGYHFIVFLNHTFFGGLAEV